jgi:hypothetical protein
MTTILNFIPIVLACFAAYLGTIRYSRERRNQDKLAIIFASIGAFGYIIAQSIQWLIMPPPETPIETLAISLWWIVNVCMMISFCCTNKPRIQK